MPSYKSYSIEQYQAFLSQPFSNNFGIAENDVANWFMQQAGARPVINSYGVTKENLLSTYIPRLKEAFDGGFFLFLAITVTEGGGAGNWLNHYMSDTSSGGLATMNDDIDYVYTTFTKQFPPAISAPEVGGAYVEDVAGQTNAVYNAVPASSLGSYFMPSTMAGNAWVFGEQWCLANQGASPPAVYFGNPYDDIIRTIKSCGADPFGDTPALPNPDPETPPVSEGGKGDQPSELEDNILKIANMIIEAFEDALNYHTYSLSSDRLYSNALITVEKTYNNTYKVSFLQELLEAIKGLLNTKDTGENQSGAGQQDKEPDGGNNKPPSIAGGKDNETMQEIAKWCESNLGGSFDYDGAYGAQCVDLVNWVAVNVFGLSIRANNNNNYPQPENCYAKRIWENPVPDDWEKVNGDPNNDQNALTIWNSLPNGCVVWFTNAWAGHVGFKAGNDWLTYNQNVDDPAGNGGPLRKTNLSGFIAGGSGFLGAWVKK